MTSIAYRSGILAADSGCWVDSVLISRVNKIQRSPNGELATGTGPSFIVEEFKRWCWDGCQGRFQPPPHEPDDGFTGLVIDSKGMAWLYDLHGNSTQCKYEPYLAIGYGQEFMLGAMACGRSAQQAVELACEFVAYAKPPVQVERAGLGTLPEPIQRPSMENPQGWMG